MIPGYATGEGTARYRDRFKGRVAEGHFRQSQGLWMSSIGLGTYLGESNEETDRRYREAVTRALELGCNVFDSAINYRFQRSERSIGEALAQAVADGKAAREEVIVASKCGFLTFDGTIPGDQRRYFMETYVQPGIIDPQDVVQGMHCMTPRYITDQIDRSRRNLRLECIDIYYLHNPETQLEEVDPPEFDRRLRDAFAALEQAVRDGKIRMYGTATWEGYRAHPNSHNFLPLEHIVNIARQAGGADHHFKVIQLPYNLSMQDAFSHGNQTLGEQALSPVEAAAALGLTVMCSASILQSRLARNLPAVIGEHLTGLQTDAQRAIQFVRSTPGVTVALVGMSRSAHVEENLHTATVPPVPSQKFMEMF